MLASDYVVTQAVWGQGLKARWHLSTWVASHVDTWVHKQARHIDRWESCKHSRDVGMWAREHRSHVGTWACKHARHVGTWAYKHARYVSMFSGRRARNLADSRFLGFFRVSVHKQNNLYYQNLFKGNINWYQSDNSVFIWWITAWHYNTTKMCSLVRILKVLWMYRKWIAKIYIDGQKINYN